jgi:hypothetical protein
MTLLVGTLATELENLVPSSTESEAIGRLVDAWEVYFNGAVVNGAALAPGSIVAGLSAMGGALVGMSATGAGAAKIAAGISAFWSAIAALAPTIWITAPVVLVPPIAPPLGLPTLAATLASTFAANTAGNLSLAQASQQIAAVLHAGGGIGALVPGSVPPAPPAPLPIL